MAKYYKRPQNFTTTINNVEILRLITAPKKWKPLFSFSGWLIMVSFQNPFTQNGKRNDFQCYGLL